MQTWFDLPPHSVRTAIVRHPFLAVATAAAVGATLALGERSRSVVIRMATAAAAGSIFSIVREHVWRELLTQAGSWLASTARNGASSDRAPTAAS